MASEKDKEKGQSLFSVFKSVSASMFGVQGSKQHEEDFAKGSIGTYIFVGAVATLLFILAVWGLVKFAVGSLT
ncbi:MAG: DUF2970 domain-containing protein [Gammaproteobacteria bacterium]